MSENTSYLPDRNLAMELVRVTEAAALASGRWVGRGMKNEGDGAAVDAMRKLINSVAMKGVVVIGEGEKDEAPMLFNGEEVGTGEGAAMDIAVDPVDGTRLMAEGRPNAISVIAAAERGTMYDPSAVFYMEKIAVGPEAVGSIDINQSVQWNIESVAKAKGLRTADITIWRQMQELFAELVDQILAPVGVEHELSYNRGVPPVLNDDVATAMLASAAQSIDPQAVVQAPQSSGGEDFSWYLEKVPGSMARLGCWSGEGEQHDLHMGDLIVDERAIGVGIKLFGAVVEQFMGENAQAD